METAKPDTVTETVEACRHLLGIVQGILAQPIDDSSPAGLAEWVMRWGNPAIDCLPMITKALIKAKGDWIEAQLTNI